MAVAMIGPKFYAWDRNGKPLAFGKLYTYQARTNVPKPTYQSEDQVVENTNPVILNGEGYANVYLAGSYKMVLKDSNDNEIWSSDPVTENSASEWVNCSSADYISPTSISVTGNVSDKYDPGRAVRLSDGISYFYSTVKQSNYSAGITNIEILDGVVPVGLSEICASIIGLNSTSNDYRYKVTFKREGGYSAVENMVAGRANGVESAISLIDGGVYSTGSTEWVYNSTGSTPVIDDFTPIGVVFAYDIQGAEYLVSTQIVDSILKKGATVNTSGSELNLGSLDINNPCSIVGDGKFLMQPSSRINVTAANVLFKDFTMDYQDKEVALSAIRLYETTSNFKADGIKIKNIKTEVETGEQYGIIIDAENVIDYEILNCTFENISAMGDADGSETNNGFCGGVFLRGFNATYLKPSSGKILNCTFKNIYTERNPAWTGSLDWDADGIRSYIDGSDYNTSNRWVTQISGCTFNKVQKSGIKLSGTPGFKIEGNTYISGDAGGQGLSEMLACERVQWTKDTDITNSKAIGNFQRLVSVSGAGVTVDGYQHYAIGVNDKVSSAAVEIQNRLGIINADVNIRNITLKSARRLVNILEETGNSVSIRNLNIENVTCDRVESGTDLLGVLNIQDALNVNITNVTVYDPNNLARPVISLKDSKVVKINNCKLESAGRLIITKESPGEEVKNIQIMNSVFTRRGLPITVNERFIDIRTGTSTLATNITINNLVLNLPTAESTKNDNPIILKAENVNIDGISAYIYSADPSHSHGLSGGLIQLVDCGDSSISNINIFDADSGITNTWRSVVLDGTTNRVKINDVFTPFDGLGFYGSSDNIYYDKIIYGVGKSLLQNASSGTNFITGNNNHEI